MGSHSAVRCGSSREGVTGVRVNSTKKVAQPARIVERQRSRDLETGDAVDSWDIAVGVEAWRGEPGLENDAAACELSSHLTQQVIDLVREILSRA
jgi:hypothetical protein